MDTDWRAKSALIGLLAISGCTTPFADSTRMDWSARNGTGTIAVSKPKVYRREALINERREELAWLDQQLKDSDKADFKPELVREVETITSLTAAFGLSINPAAGITNRRNQETGELQQQINAMNLQIELNQLKRRLAAEEASGAFETGAITPPAAGGAAAASDTSAGLDQLKAAIERLDTSLKSRLDAEGKPAATANAFTNPLDSFRDRSTLRGVIRSAENAASLDELHDIDGATLIRLNFEATVLPDPQYARSPGVLQMKVEPPAIDGTALEGVYTGWLDYLNANLNQRAGDGWKADWRLLNSAAADNFETLQYLYPKPGAAAGVCPGPVLGAAGARPAECHVLQFAIPWFAGTTPGDGAFQTLWDYLYFYHLSNDDAADQAESIATHNLMLKLRGTLQSSCGVPAIIPQGFEKDFADLQHDMGVARIRVASAEALQRAVRTAESLLQQRNVAVPTNDTLATIRTRALRAKLLVATYRQIAFGDARCAALGDSFDRNGPKRLVPAGFIAALRASDPGVRVYEVGPREQVQQMSTVARAANSVALAASIAASDPSSGIAANAAASYSRQAMARAATLERLPSVVGYASQASPTYGWVIGPKATVNPKGKIEIAHALRPYDLSVDLSVPGWWPYFTLQTTTAWAPSRSDLVAGTVTGTSVPIKVDMAPNSADYAAISGLVARGDTNLRREVRLDTTDGISVNACRPTTILLRGENLWRATALILDGRKIDGAALAVAPDMSGLIVDVPALDTLIGDVSAGQLPLIILTPYGPANADIDYVRKPTAGCPTAAAAKPEGPSIAQLSPLQFRAPADMTFTVKGSKLDKVSAATLNGQGGAVTAAADGKTVTVRFTAAQTAGLPVSRTVPLTLFVGADAVAEKLVEVTANGASN